MSPIDDSNDTYYEIIKAAAEAKRDENIPNSTMDHAEIGIRFLFSNADAGSTVLIVSEKFFDEFWGRLKNVLIDFMKKMGNIEIILMQSKNQFLEDLQKVYGAQLKTFVVNKDTIQKEKIPHFVVSSPIGYRIELSDELMKDKIVKGVLNFGDIKGTQSLKKFFTNLKSLSSETTAAPQQK